MMKEMKANDVMKKFENQNVVNRAEFTFEEYLEQLTGFQKIVSSSDRVVTDPKTYIILSNRRQLCLN